METKSTSGKPNPSHSNSSLYNVGYGMYSIIGRNLEPPEEASGYNYRPDMPVFSDAISGFWFGPHAEDTGTASVGNATVGE